MNSRRITLRFSRPLAISGLGRALRRPASRGDRYAIASIRTLQKRIVPTSTTLPVGKQAHWNVEGHHFRSLHLELDELVEAWRSLGDDVAERAVALGLAPDGRAQTIAATSEIEPLTAGRLTDRDVVEAITERLALVVVRTRERIHHAHVSDPVTEDLLIRIAATLEKQLWMIRVQRETT